MSDLFQEVLQQRHARSVDGNTLELMGKKAAALWQEGRCKTLSEAVVEIVKHAALSPEQVRRVIEFTNVDAYQKEFRKEGSRHRIVDFGEGGPASPSAVLQDLNDGGGGTVFDRGTYDYCQPPKEKIAEVSIRDEKAFEDMFKVAAPDIPEENPLGDAIALWEKLSSNHQLMTSQLGLLEVAYDELVDRLFGHVKQAALEGHALSEIAAIWEDVAPDAVFIKTAFRHMYEPLLQQGVFDHDTLVDSMEKIAYKKASNPEHPIVKDFIDYCSVLEKMAQLRDQRDEVAEAVGSMTVFLKTATAAGAGAWSAAKKWGGKGLELAGKGGEYAGEFLLGPDVNKNIAKRVGQGAALAGTALVGNEIRREAMATKPGQMAQRAGSAIGAAIPGTEAYNRRNYELMARAQGQGGY